MGGGEEDDITTQKYYKSLYRNFDSLARLYSKDTLLFVKADAKGE